MPRYIAKPISPTVFSVSGTCGPQAQEGKDSIQVVVVPGGAAQVVQTEVPAQPGGRCRLVVLRPQLSQARTRIVRLQAQGLVAAVQPDQQPFEIWFQPDQEQVPSAPDPVRTTAGGPVGLGAVSVKKDQGARVTNSGLVSFPSLLDGIFDDCPGIAPAGDDDIEMKPETLSVAQLLQPRCESTLAVAFRNDKET